MIYKWNEIVKKEGGRFFAETCVKEGKYKKVAHGLYTDDGGLVSELEQLFLQYPRATLTNESAFDFYQLSTLIPEKYYLVTPYNSHTIKNKKVVQTYMDEQIINIGRIKKETDYGFIYIFDKERMLIELFRLKNKFPRDYYMEIVSSYRTLFRNSEISTFKLSDYCKHFKNGVDILKQIQEVFHE